MPEEPLLEIAVPTMCMLLSTRSIVQEGGKLISTHYIPNFSAPITKQGEQTIS